MKIKTTTANTPALQDYFDAWARLDQRRETVRTDNNLSLQGKRAAFETIEADRARLKADMYQAFVSVYDALNRDYKTNKKARGAAIEKSLSRWESLANAITSEAERVRGMLKRGVPANELRAAWESVNDSGAMIRAWYLAFAGTDKTGEDFNSLRAEVNREYDALHNDIPEMKAVDTKGAGITSRGVALRDDIVSFMTLLSSNGSTAFDPSGTGRDLQNMLMRLKVNNHMENGLFYKTLEIIDSPQDELEKLIINESSFSGVIFTPSR